MKNKDRIKFLLGEGLSIQTIANLNESQLIILSEKFKKSKKEETSENWTETSTVSKKLTAPTDSKDLPIPPAPPGKTNKITVSGGTIQLTQNEGEMTEDDTNNVTSSNALGDLAIQSYTGQEAPHDANDEACDGMGDDSCNNRSEEGIAESRINEKFESKAQQNFFWAKCNTTRGVQKQKWCKLAKEFSDETTKKDYKKMPEKLHPEKTVKYKK